MDKQEYLDLYYQMVLIRIVEERAAQLYQQGKIGGFLHLYIGQEAVSTGIISVRKPQDRVITAYRDHGVAINCGISADEVLAELLGKSTGTSKGKGGSMHIADVTAGNLGANGIVGGSVDIATGAALTCRMKEKDKIVLCFFGDGAANRGNFHGSLNMASIWDLPIIYVCENNQYGMSMPVKEAFNIKRISDRKCAYNIEGMTVDGNNIVEVYNTIKHFTGYCRSGKGPVLVECLTYRWKGHSKSDAQVYRAKEEVKDWIDRDPIPRYRNTLIESKVITEKDDRKIEDEVLKEIEDANRFAEESPFPDPSEVEEDVDA